MRSTFADIMKNRKVDIALEYRRLHELVYGSGDYYSAMERCFHLMPFRGTAIDLDDFEHECSLSFAYTNHISLDGLLGFAEYVYNFAYTILSSIDYNAIDYHESSRMIILHIDSLVAKLDYEFSYDDGFYILVAGNNEAWAASEVAPQNIASDLVNYAYRGLAGNLDAKRAKLVKIINELEPKRYQLKTLSKELESSLFYLANNFNIRHNNLAADFPKQYNPALSELSESELEAWYDEMHRMCVAAILLLDFDGKKDQLDQFKARSTEA